jgi:hypothetical protein
MNQRIKELAIQAGLKWKEQPPHFSNTSNPTDFPQSANADLEKFAELIIQEFNKSNQAQSYELLGVITDVEEGNGFDNICLDTVKRVCVYLAKTSTTHYFGVVE